MKTIKEWLEGLDEPERSQALTNLNLHYVNIERESADRALLVSFCWSDSSEGVKYWSEIFEKYKIRATHDNQRSNGNIK